MTAASKDESRYTKPKLRERLKEEIKQGDKGGKPGQWSARKAQLLVQEYEKRGGGYTDDKGPQQKSLEKWTDEEWQTKEGDGRARKGSNKRSETKRYLPKKAWEQLSDEEKRKTDERKRKASKQGRQFVPNTDKAKRAGKRARSGGSSADTGSGSLESRTKDQLYHRAKELDIAGRSDMSKAELIDAIRNHNG